MTTPRHFRDEFGTEVAGDVLAAVGADIEVVRRLDGVYRVYLDGGGYIAFGEDDGYWTATEYLADDVHSTLYAGGSLAELAAIIRRRVGL